MSGNASVHDLPQIDVHQQVQSTETETEPSTQDHLAFNSYAFANQDPTMISDIDGIPAVFDSLTFDFSLELESSLFHSAGSAGMNFLEPLALPQFYSGNAGRTSRVKV